MSWDLQNLDSDDFVKDYWQKKPCLIKNAFIDLISPISPEELAGLACEEGVHSRLVMEKGGMTPWQLRYGPFQEADFTSLPQSHYSLLVSECEKWIPEFAELLDAFRFLPSWRIDDVMVSYAPSGGSVGPHTDEYDVFLLQFHGQRNWQYTDQRIDPPALIANLDLAIMQEFVADQEAILEPGDMLYLPPGVAHHGVAIDSCMTCSIGFRAPTAAEILESFTLETDNKEIGLERYSDPDLETGRHFGEITRTEINRFRQLVNNLLDQPQTTWADSIGKLLSDTVVSESGESISFKNIDELLTHDWMINPDSKMLYHRDDSNIRFYCNGNLSLLSADNISEQVVQQLCGSIELNRELIQLCKSQLPLSELLINMANNAAIIPIED